MSVKRGSSSLERLFEAIWSSAGGPAPTKEHRFHETRRFRFDFAWVDQKVAVECEGGLYLRRSGHNTAVGIKRDMTKGNLAVLSGWRVLRYSADDLSKRPDEVVEEVKGVLGID